MDVLLAAWHSEGQGFESPRVHHVMSQDIEDGDACCKTLWTGHRPLRGW